MLVTAPKNGMKLAFTLSHPTAQYTAKKNGSDVLTVRTADGLLTVSVFYDFSEIPLILTAAVKDSDRVELILYPHRIELWVNGTLRDEDWPAGQLLYGADAQSEGDLSLSLSACTEEAPLLPSVLATFENAEGWQPEESVFVGDCMPYTDNGRYHVLYLKDRRHHRSKWCKGAHQWEHISSADLVSWQIHPMAVAITSPEEGSICTGSHIRDRDTHYLFYTVRMADGSPARICRSTSKDGYHFTKDESFAFTLSDKYDKPSARDPKLIRDEDGHFHMILTTSLAESNRGCLAHLVSDDLFHFTECEEPIYVADDETQPECPDHIYYNGRYYLIFSLNSKAHYMISSRPFDGFYMPIDPIIPCHSVPKGAVWDGKILFTGFQRLGGYAGTMTFRRADANGDGTLRFL